MDAITGLDGCAERSVHPGKVDTARTQLLDQEEATRLAEVFRLLGDPTRARLLYALLEGGEMCVCDLAEAVETSDTSCSHALRLLRTAGIVTARREGRMMFYRLADAHVRMLLDLSREHLRHSNGPQAASQRSAQRRAAREMSS